MPGPNTLLDSERLISTGDRSFSLAMGGFLTMAAANGIDRFVYTPILPLMMEQVGLSAGQAGLIASANFLGYLLGALFASLPDLPGSRRRWLLGALLVSGSCTAVMGLISSFPAFLIVRCIGGFAGAVAVIVAITLIVERLAAGGQGYLTALHFAGVGVGIVTSAIIVSSLMAAEMGWRTMWFAAAAASLTATIGVTALVGGQAITRRPAVTTMQVPVTRRFWFLVVAHTLTAFGYVITGTFLVARVRGSATLQPFEPWVWVVFGVACAPSVAVWGVLSRRVGTFRAFAIVCLVQSVGIVAGILRHDVAGVIIEAAFVGGSFMGLTAFAMISARALTTGDLRRPVALMTAGFGVGQMVGPTFAGLVRDATGSFLIPSLCAAAGMVLAAVLALRSGTLD